MAEKQKTHKRPAVSYTDDVPEQDKPAEEEHTGAINSDIRPAKTSKHYNGKQKPQNWFAKAKKARKVAAASRRKNQR